MKLAPENELLPMTRNRMLTEWAMIAQPPDDRGPDQKRSGGAMP